MIRILRGLFLLMVFVVACAALGVGVLSIATSGGIADDVRVALLRFQLAGREDELNTPRDPSGTLTRFTIAPGDSPAAVARRLQEAGLIADSQLFVDYLRTADLDTRVQATTYFLSAAQTIPQIAATIVDRRNSSITFRVSEGWRLEEVAQAIDDNPRFGFSGAEFLSVVQRAGTLPPELFARTGLAPDATLEGFLAADTYSLPPDITPTSLRDQLVTAFLDQLSTDDLAVIAAHGLTLPQVVTIASIVERESVFPQEDATIASVYLNRLAIGMPLQADPTVQYGLQGSRGTWWPQITQADYHAVDSPYNTYRIAALPPGPIAIPSLSALRAAIYPETTPYYFFRARCDGSMLHNFAVTYAEHQANGC